MRTRVLPWLAGVGVAVAVFVGSLLTTVTAAGIAFDRSVTPPDTD
ncbi:hypothetical protein [Natronolimnohabitans innermongolicus]|nr:hypothetical protein [Natronolimnohabitans innermongolicus]